MKTLNLFLVFSGFFLFGCEYPDPNKDTISMSYEEYRDAVLAEFTSQKQDEITQNQIITLEGDNFIIPNPDGAYQIDFSKEKIQERKQKLENVLAQGLEQLVLLQAYVFPPSEPYWNESCTTTGFKGRKRCEKYLIQRGTSRTCYLADISLTSSLLNKMSESHIKANTEKGKKLRTKLAEAFIEKQKERIRAYKSQYATSHIFSEGENYLVYKIEPKDIPMASSIDSLLQSKFAVNGRVFSAWCLDQTLDRVGFPIVVETWEAETTAEWIKKIIEANK